MNKLFQIAFIILCCCTLSMFYQVDQDIKELHRIIEAQDKEIVDLESIIEDNENNIEAYHEYYEEVFHGFSLTLKN